MEERTERGWVPESSFSAGPSSGPAIVIGIRRSNDNETIWVGEKAITGRIQEAKKVISGVESLACSPKH